jgi:uncharacterized protein (DUF2342 family)
MPAPIIGVAAAAAARLVAKKIASRATGGITGTGAKNINPTYRQMNDSQARIRANSDTVSKVTKPNTESWNRTDAIQKRSVKKLTNKKDAAFIKGIADITFPKK